MEYQRRLIIPRLLEALESFPVVVVGGPRQTGKSTILKQDPELQPREYRTCDTGSVSLALATSASAFLESFDRLSLDEAQRVPGVFLELKRLADENRKPGRFLISGSAQFLMLKNLGDSLAGRACFLRLAPLTIHEQYQVKQRPLLYRLFETKKISALLEESQAGSPLPAWSDDWLAQSAFPQPAWDKKLSMPLWTEAYETTYLERDIRELAPGIDPFAYQRLLRIAAGRTGTLLNQASIAADAGLNSMTAGRYLHLLETSGIIYRIPSFARNIGHQWTKSPKLIFADAVLAAYLAGGAQALSDPQHPLFGRFFESFILQNLAALCSCYNKGRMDILHLRASSGMEVDAVVRFGQSLVACEVKSSDSIRNNDIMQLKKFIAEEPGCIAAFCVYRGKEIVPIDHKIWAVPVGCFLS